MFIFWFILEQTADLDHLGIGTLKYSPPPPPSTSRIGLSLTVDVYKLHYSKVVQKKNFAFPKSTLSVHV